jgi:outer membrane lipoprotein-sorting protein
MVSIRPHLARSRVARLFQYSFWISWLAAATFAGAQDTNALFEKWLAVQTNLQSWTGDFTQTRSLKVLAQPLVTAGKVWVRPGEFRWELGQPPQTIVLRQPNQLLIMYPQLKHTSELQSPYHISYAVFCLKKKKRKEKQ